MLQLGWQLLLAPQQVWQLLLGQFEEQPLAPRPEARSLQPPPQAPQLHHNIMSRCCIFCVLGPTSLTLYPYPDPECTAWGKREGGRGEVGKG